MQLQSYTFFSCLLQDVTLDFRSSGPNNEVFQHCDLLYLQCWTLWDHLNKVAGKLIAFFSYLGREIYQAVRKNCLGIPYLTDCLQTGMWLGNQLSDLHLNVAGSMKKLLDQSTDSVSKLRVVGSQLGKVNSGKFQIWWMSSWNGYCKLDKMSKNKMFLLILILF